MSIIYDALKKVERSTNNQIPAQQITPKPKLKNYLLYALVAVGGIFIANTIFRTIESFNAQKPLPNLTLPAAENAPAQEITLTIPSQTALPVEPQTPTEPSPPELVLNGIFFSNEDGYALINNQIVRMGDTVAGAQVKKITSTEVELDLRGQAITLSAK